MASKMRSVKVDKERGAAMVEYALLIGALAMVVMVSLQTLGGTVQGAFSALSEVDAGIVDAGIVDSEIVDVEPAESVVLVTGLCPNGWSLIPNNLQKKSGKDVDANGDGLICSKQIPGKGKGNTNGNTNVKDNNN